MKWSAAAILSASIASCALIVSSCTADQVNYGDPEGLAGRTVPKRTLGTDQVPEGDAGSGNLYAGVCGKDPGINAAGGCSGDEWQAIYGMLVKEWTCAQIGCHNAGGTKPNVFTDGASPAIATWNEFVTYQVGGKRYVDPCSTDPNMSGILCNLNFSTGVCGSAMPKGKTLGAADKAMVEKWLTCGARHSPG